MSKIQAGDFIHVVATVNKKIGIGKILYVNPSNSTIHRSSVPDADVKLIIEDIIGNVLLQESVIIRRSSCDGLDESETGLIQADLPRQDGMKAISLVVNGNVVSRYESGTPTTVPQGSTMGLSLVAGATPHRRQLTLSQAAALQPEMGVTYSIMVKPDTGKLWNTLAVGRATPDIEIDRNQFAGATKLEVKVLRTTGFEEETIVQDTIDLF